jgi:glucan-binding YG repeat protein
MRKQTKLVAVLSAAALLAMGASMTSFAAGWEKDDAGIWHYYDSDDEMVTDEWKKDEGKWFYLNEDGDMLTSSWVDDDYYVDDKGAMVVNGWVKTYSDEDMDDPDEDGEYWYYFGSKGKKVVDDDKKINGRTYYFDEDGKMMSGWQEFGGNAYYLGGEDEGWRAENQWLWLEKSGMLDSDDDDEITGKAVIGCSENDDCDDEGWYWFQSSGKAYKDEGKKKINGKYYIFNNHGQMLYEWIDNDTRVTVGSNAQLDGNIAEGSKAEIGKMLYYNVVDDGSRGNGWYEIDGSEDVGTDDDTDWYYIDDGEVKYAEPTSDNEATYDDSHNMVYVAREKINGKYFAFNEVGQMQTGLQYIKDDKGFYYFDDNGYQKTGRVASVECDDDDHSFYFNTKNGKNGQGIKGEKDGYLYFNGKRLEADDDCRLYYYAGDIYLVNTKGKIQKAKDNDGKKFDVENKGINAEDVIVKTDKDGKVEWISLDGKDKIEKNDMISKMITDITVSVEGKDKIDSKEVTEDTYVSVPYIQLYDDDLYTYSFTTKSSGGYDFSEGWLQINKPSK